MMAQALDERSRIQQELGFLACIAAASLWPFANFINVNRNEISEFDKIALYALTNVIVFLLFSVILRTVFRMNAFAAVNATLVSCMAFYLYGAADLVIKDQFEVFRHRYSLILWLVGWSILIALVWRFGRTRVAFQVAAAASVLMFATPAAMAVYFYATQTDQIQEPDAKAWSTAQSPAPANPDAPNVYMIVLDNYGREDKLLARFGFNNAPFLDAMRDRGFYVADKSYANFPMTYLSISSTMSMDYVVAPGTGNIGHVQRYSVMIGGVNETVRRFKELGYKYIHVTHHGWLHTSCQAVADVCLTGESVNRFALLTELEANLLKLTPLYPLLLQYFPDFLVYERYSLTNLSDKLEVVTQRSPAFVFFHNFDAHGLRFDEKCQPLRSEDLQLYANMDYYGANGYVRSLECINSEVLHLTDRIHAADPDAIIIYQADHGFNLRKDWGAFEDWKPDELENRYSVLNTLRVPQRCQDMLYPSISPVNTFRVVLNCITGDTVPLLKDKSFWSSADKDLVKQWK